MQKQYQSMELVTWESVRQQVKKVAYDIYVAIEKLDLTKSHRLYKVRYPYGAMIIGEGGVCNIPNKNGVLVPIIDASIPQKIKEDLNYNWNGIPMSLVLSGKVELFVENKSKEIGLFAIGEAGVMLALRRVLDFASSSYQAVNLWRMSSGVRSIYSLASIYDAASFLRLKKYFNLSVDKSQIKQDIWPLLVELANSAEFPKNWRTEHLFFGSEWLKPPKNDAWKAFRLALFERAWKTSAYVRNAEVTNYMWNLFRDNKKISDSTFQMIKYIVEASLGQAYLYKPADSSDAAGPFTDFTNIFLNVYGLKKYVPVIMCADSFYFQKNYPGYVSVQKPFRSISKNQYNNLIVVARDISQTLKSFLDELANGIIKVADTPFHDLLSLNFDFYHSDEDINKEFLPSSEIFSDDPVVQKLISSITNKEIPFRNDLLRSCIKISKNKDCRTSN